jgi:hypothetical protein
MKAIFLSLAVFIFAVSAQANTIVTITFPTSSAQTGQTLLSTLSALDPNTVFTAQDTSSASLSVSGPTGLGGVLSVITDSNGADILIEFTVPVASVSVDFPGLLNTSCPNTNCYSAHLVAYDSAAVGLTPAQVQALPGADVIYSTLDQQEPVNPLVGSGTQNDIYAIQIESSAVAPTGSTYTQIDQIVYTQVTGAPEPGTFALIGAGLMALGLARRKRIPAI